MAYPDFFSSLKEGFLYGGQLKREDEERKRRDAMQTLQTLLSMQASGSARAEDVNAYLAANQAQLPAGMAGIQSQKLQPELRQDILAGTTAQVPMVSAAFGTPITVPIPTAGDKMVTSDQRRAAGLPSYEEIENERSRNAQAQQQLTLNQQAIEMGREEMGPLAQTSRQVKRLGDIVATTAPGYVDNVINKGGGWKILVSGQGKKKPDQIIPELAESSYDAFVKGNKIGPLDDGQKEFVRASMQTVLLDRQLQAVNAQAQLLSAQYRLSLGANDPLSRMMDDVAKRLDQNLKTQQELQMYGMLAGSSAEEISKMEPMMQDGIRRWWLTKKEEINLKVAQSRLAMGDMNVSQYLAPISDASATEPINVNAAATEIDPIKAAAWLKNQPRAEQEKFLNDTRLTRLQRDRIRMELNKK